jgi:hypothetical protein
MKSIQKAIADYIAEGGGAVYATADGESGVVFTDENEFFAWEDLGLSKDLGFYRLSRFPDVANECAFYNWTVRPVETADDWPGFAILDGDGYGFMAGERWQLEELYYRLRRFLRHGDFDEPIADDDEALGSVWYTINEAVHAAHDYDPAEYPLNERTAERIRRAAQRGTLAHVQTDSGRYKFRAARFRHWLTKGDK